MYEFIVKFKKFQNYNINFNNLKVNFYFILNINSIVLYLLFNIYMIIKEKYNKYKQK